MPHYKDGTLAKEGDIVRGIPYNTQGKEVVGVIFDINPAEETCNCKVAFVEVKPRDEIPHEIFVNFVAVLGDNKHVELIAKYDYGEVKAFERIL